MATLSPVTVSLADATTPYAPLPMACVVWEGVCVVVCQRVGVLSLPTLLRRNSQPSARCESCSSTREQREGLEQAVETAGGQRSTCDARAHWCAAPPPCPTSLPAPSSHTHLYRFITVVQHKPRAPQIVRPPPGRVVAWVPRRRAASGARRGWWRRRRRGRAGGVARHGSVVCVCVCGGEEKYGGKVASFCFFFGCFFTGPLSSSSHSLSDFASRTQKAYLTHSAPPL